MRFLADENFIGDAVRALRTRGHDVDWILEQKPGSIDDEVLALAQQDKRILLTFDKDFGELAFKLRLPATSGILLFRLRNLSPSEMTSLIVAAVESQPHWEKTFAVISRDRIRMIPLPAR